MAIRTPQQYIESLRDGRVILHDGESVPDITVHPAFRPALNLGVILYLLYQDPKYRPLLTVKLDNGEEAPFIFRRLTNSQDLLHRRDYILTMARICLGAGGGPCYVGPDALNALTVISRKVDKDLGTNYVERVENYRMHLLKNDLAVAGAITDVKGDRMLRPAEQKPHKDFYVRWVGQNEKGIIVRGAKFHISRTAICNEIFVSPTRAMREEDKDYAVAFAVPVNTPGVKLLSASQEYIEEGNLDEWPMSAARNTIEALIVFEDALIPWDRVFLNREWQYAGQVARMFGNFHRLYADTYKYADLEILTGVAALMAEYNGIEKADHIRDELAWLVWYTETVGLLGKAACEQCYINPEIGIAYPNQLYSNAAKYMFASLYHQAVRYVQDITGGIAADLPRFKNFLSPETRPYMEKYFKGKAEIPTEHRLRAAHLAKDACASFHMAATIHAEGSLPAQQIALVSVADWDRYKAIARRAARISDGSEHPLTKELHPFPPDLDAIMGKK